MTVDCLLPNDEAHELIEITRDIADKALEPIVDELESMETYSDGAFPMPGADHTCEVYLHACHPARTALPSGTRRYGAQSRTEGRGWKSRTR